MNPDHPLSARLQQLEASVAHLERLADQLNEALIAQGRQVVRVQKQLDSLAEALLAREEPAVAPPQERPPHYGR